MKIDIGSKLEKSDQIHTCTCIQLKILSIIGHNSGQPEKSIKQKEGSIQESPCSECSRAEGHRKLHRQR